MLPGMDALECTGTGPKLRDTFDQDAERYLRARPRYPPSLVAELSRVTAAGPGVRVLEIAPGTGQLTVDLAGSGCAITAVELGPSLAAVARRELAAFPAVDVVTAWHYPDLAAPGGYGMAPAGIEPAWDFEEIAGKIAADAISSTLDPASDVPVRPRIGQGHAAQVLLDASAGADLLVVGSRGHGGFAGALLGSVSEYCVRHASVPVVVVPDPARLTKDQTGEELVDVGPANG